MPILDLPVDLPQRLSEQEKKGIRWEGGRENQSETRFTPAAVLLPLIRLDEQWHLVYTLRSIHLHDHSGQVSFPGGSWEPGDTSLIRTALRSPGKK